jgi:hypothetical protein
MWRRNPKKEKKRNWSCALPAKTVCPGILAGRPTILAGRHKLELDQGLGE